MRRFEQTTKSRVHLPWTARVIHTLSRLGRGLSERMYGVLFTFIQVAEVCLLLLFQLVVRYESVLGGDDIEEFAEDVYSVGVYDLPCGGGIVTNPLGVSR